MHGRVKVRTTAEQEALKKIERDKKLAKYKVAIALVFKKRAEKVWDDELLTVTELMVLQNPDIYTLWNIRREAFENNNWGTEERTERLTKELTLTESCLRENPKSYGVWHHRCWVIDHLPQPDWKTELELCAKCLTLDERNFHCWDYRQYLVKKAGISDVEEFDFSTSKIYTNFSNYSSWHYRSKLLSKMFPDENHELPITADKHKEELDLVMNATFTDPNDSSAWFYQRWLLDYSETKRNVVWRARITSTEATIIFAKDVRIGADKLALLKNGSAIEPINWKSANGKEYSKCWSANLADKWDNEATSIAIQFNECTYDLSRSSKNIYWFYKSENLASEAHNKTQLKEQMENYEQLRQMEPNNKWAILTGICLMKNYDLIEYNAKIIEDLSALLKIDKLRYNYYSDMRSKYILEYKLYQTWQTENEEEEIAKSINLSNLDLTAVHSEHQLCLFDDINLESNRLQKSLHHLVALQQCKKLSLASNSLTTLQFMPALGNLETLSLRNNDLTNVDEIIDLVRRHENLTSLDLRDNPVAKVDTIAQQISDVRSTLVLILE